ncbi:MAG TPA: hypothetical protein VH253_07775 [Phycisphaerae bacterium]|nr:hypothetical protein [Phycisphaerae bacterium]
MDMPVKSSIKRSWATTVGFLVAAVVAGAVSVGLFMTIVEGAVTAGIACIPAVLALIFLFMAIGGAGVASCPGCGERLTNLGTGSNEAVLCPKCLKYYEGTGGELWATDMGKVAASAVYTTKLPEKFQFPEGCCVCGKPATQRVKVETRMMNASSAVTAPAVGYSSSTVTSVEVPHCAEHKDGAMLSGTSKDMRIRFRSYPYMRAFCELNGVGPG